MDAAQLVMHCKSLKPKQGLVWFAFDDTRPPACIAGIWARADPTLFSEVPSRRVLNSCKPE